MVGDHMGILGAVVLLLRCGDLAPFFLPFPPPPPPFSFLSFLGGGRGRQPAQPKIAPAGHRKEGPKFLATRPGPLRDGPLGPADQLAAVRDWDGERPADAASP